MYKSTEKYYAEAAKKLGWTIEFDGKRANLQTYSDKGQDVNFDISFNDEDDFLEEIERIYESYDPSQEAYLWLDSSGHGKNGAPYDMKDVYDDMKEVETRLHDLSDYLVKISSKTVKQIIFAIQNGRFSFERQLKIGVYNGDEICIMPLHCPFSPFRQIGWYVSVPSARCIIRYDYELHKIDIE